MVVRTKIELPEKLISKLKQVAMENGVSPSVILREAIEKTDIEPTDIAVGTINLSWNTEHEEKLKDLSQKNKIIRGDKSYNTSKVTIIQYILEKYLKSN